MRVLEGDPSTAISIADPAIHFVGHEGARIVLPGVPLTTVTPPGRVTREVDRVMFVVPSVPHITAELFDSKFPIFVLMLPWGIVGEPLGLS